MIFAFILAGLIGGLIGGMGMGGGTLLIPLLTMFLGVEQHTAQAINLLVFVPTAVVAVIIHAKNKLINFRVSMLVAVPAIIVAVCASLLVGNVSSYVLKILFAVFLILVGVFELYKATISVIKKQKPLLKTKDCFSLAKNCKYYKFYVKK